VVRAWSGGVIVDRGDEVAIIGGGIGGLTLALALHARDVPCRVYEAAPELRPLGTGISLLPHGTRELEQLGLLSELERRAVTFGESRFFTSLGQEIFRDEATPGLPQLLIHRADLHDVLVQAVGDRLGPERLVLNHGCTGVEQDSGAVTAGFTGFGGVDRLHAVRAMALVGCDGIHSAVRSQYYPQDELVFSGINMWRGLTVHPPILSGRAHIRIGSLRTGKLVVYPIRDAVDDPGGQLINWVAEVNQAERGPAEWSRAGQLEDFLPYYRDWHFPWLDVPELLGNAHVVLEYPMVDREPVPRWSFDRVTLLGDAAHPMVPRGSNGAMQAILDARALADALASEPSPPSAFRRYEAERLDRVNAIVLANRTAPPDILIETVQSRSGDRPFDRLEDVVEEGELRELLERYKRLTGYDAQTLRVAGPAG